MELRESIQHINNQLLAEYGKHSDGRPNFRVVFSEDQYEKRWTQYTDDGFQLLQPEVRLLPKYKQYMAPRFVLERLLPVMGETDLVEKTSYEPAWVFQDRYQNYLPPFFDGCKYVIESILSVAGHKSHAKYKDPEASPELRAERLKKVQDDLFGNETDTGDHLAYGTGVISPGHTSDELTHRELKDQIQQAESTIEVSKLVH